MASKFNVEFTIREPPDQAEARAADALNEPARTVGLRLARRGASKLDYRPRYQFPFLLMLYHTLSGERMTVTFEPDPGGGTRVSITGAVARSKLPVASDTEHWSDALGGSGGG